MYRVYFDSLGTTDDRLHVHVTCLVAGQASTPHDHDFYEVFLVMEGAGTHHLNGNGATLAAGHLVPIRPADVHCFSTTAAQKLVFVNVAVSKPWWDAFHAIFALPAWTEPGRGAILNPADTVRLSGELQELARTGDPFVNLRVWKGVEDHLRPDRRHAAPAPPDWLEALRRDLASMPAALGEPISFWQDRSGRSAEHLARTCRRFYGMAFRDLINQARIDRAKLLLRTTDKKVITVAYDCGFGNMANFHRLFARLTGVTPNRWRRAVHPAVPVPGLR